MKEDHSFTATFLVDQTPEQAYRAITQVDRWWSQEIEGKAAQVGDVFLYRYQDVHRCAIKVIEADPGRRMVWLVLENEFSFIKDKTEWVNTTIRFDLSREGTQTRVRFTHEGLVQAYECYEVCANAWTSYVTGSLRGLITTGQGQPNVRTATEGGPAPKGASFTTSFTVDKDPQEVFDAINNVRGWWGGEIEGAADKLGDEFSYRYNDLHFSTQKVTELVPGKRVVWHVLDAALSFTRNPAEWKGTDICFDIARRGDRTEVVFTHAGLVPEFECYQDCSTGWRFYVNGSLHNFISGAKLAVGQV